MFGEQSFELTRPKIARTFFTRERLNTFETNDITSFISGWLTFLLAGIHV